MDHSSYYGEQHHYSKVLRFHLSAVDSRARGEGSPHPPAFGPCGLGIEFSKVSFQDGASGDELLTNISFHVRPGARVGIVGPSGSGKMNLLNLLTRLHEPAAGAILLDRKDVREYEHDALRRQFSIVPHDPMLLASTVAANIACADPQASRAQVVRAAKSANAHDFIESLPRGYETLLGEGGATLSPGERHRLAIARAFLKNAPMLVLDESAGTEDFATEQLIVDALDRLMAGRTSLTIAYRISTLERCDMVLVLKKGSLDAVCTGDDYAKVPRLSRLAPGSVPRSIDMLKPGPVLVRIDKPVVRPRF